MIYPTFEDFLAAIDKDGRKIAMSTSDFYKNVVHYRHQLQRMEREIGKKPTAKRLQIAEPSWIAVSQILPHITDEVL